MTNPWVVDADTETLDVGAWTDVNGRTWKVWVKVKAELSVGEARAMMRKISSVSQPLSRTRTIEPEAKLEWTEYSFARMSTYVVDWSFAHEADYQMAPTRENFEKLHTDLFEMIDNAIDAHETAVREKKARIATETRPALTSL